MTVIINSILVQKDKNNPSLYVTELVHSRAVAVLENKNAGRRKIQFSS